MLAELMVLPRELKSAQVSRYAGLDVRLCQSGTSVNRPGRLSKAGNAYRRAAFYMPALSAVRHDPNVKAFYEALQKRGKKKDSGVVRRDAQVPDRCLGLPEAWRTFRLSQVVQC